MTSLFRASCLVLVLIVLPFTAQAEEKKIDLPKLPKLEAPALGETHNYAYELPNKYYDEVTPLLEKGDSKAVYELMMKKVEAGDADAAYAMGRLHLDGVNTKPDKIEAAAWFDVAFNLSPELWTQSRAKYELEHIVVLFTPDDRMANTARIRDRSAAIIEKYYSDAPDAPGRDTLFEGKQEQAEGEEEKQPTQQVTLARARAFTTDTLRDLYTFTPENFTEKFAALKAANKEAWGDIKSSVQYSLNLYGVTSNMPPGSTTRVEFLKRPYLVVAGERDGEFQIALEAELAVYFPGPDGKDWREPAGVLATLISTCSDNSFNCDTLKAKQALLRGSGHDVAPLKDEIASAGKAARDIVEQAYNIDLQGFAPQLESRRKSFSDTAWPDYTLGLTRLYKSLPGDAELVGKIMDDAPHVTTINDNPYEFGFSYVVAAAARDPEVINPVSTPELYKVRLTLTCTSAAGAPCTDWQVTQWLAMDYEPQMLTRD